MTHGIVLDGAQLAELASPHLRLSLLVSTDNTCADHDCLARKIHYNYLCRDLNVYWSWLLDRYLVLLGPRVRAGYAVVVHDPFAATEDAAWWSVVAVRPRAEGADVVAVHVELVSLDQPGAYTVGLLVAQRDRDQAAFLPLVTPSAALLARVPWDRVLPQLVPPASAPLRVASVVQPGGTAALMWFHVLVGLRHEEEEEAKDKTNAAAVDVPRTLAAAGAPPGGVYIFEIQFIDAVAAPVDHPALMQELRRFEVTRAERLLPAAAS